MATDTANSNPPNSGASNSEQDASASADSKRGVRKKAELPPELDQLMKELAGDTSAGGASTLGRLERRVGMLETAFAEIVERHESSMRDRSGQLSAVEETVLALRNRMDESHKNYTAAAAQLRSALGEVGVRLNGLEAQRQDAPAPFVLPVVTENTAFEAVGSVSPGEPEEAPSRIDAPQETPPVEKRVFEGPDYLSAARRAANASVGNIEMDEHAAAPAPRRANRMRLLLAGCAAPVLLLLAGATFFINRHPATAQPKRAPVAISAAATKQADAVPLRPAQNLPPPAVAVGAPEDPVPSEVASSAASNELQEKAGQGNAAAARDLGLKYLTGDGIEANEDEAVHWLLRAAYNGEPDAQYWLGTLYTRGRGVPEDEAQALHWYEAAAKQGNAKAMHRLGVAYFEGQGVEKSDTDAAHWFSQAADLGNTDAAFNLAVLYERGAGVEKSSVDAYKWYAIAARGGDKQAASRVEVLAKQLQPSELAAGTHAATEFKPKTTGVADSQ